MSETYDFAARAYVRRQELNEANAAAALENKSLQEQIRIAESLRKAKELQLKRLRVEKQTRDANFIGTRPSEVLGAADCDTLQSFLGYMAVKEYRGSRILYRCNPITERKFFRDETVCNIRQARGYLIGSVDQKTAMSMPGPDSEGDLYICSDGFLRVGHQAAIHKEGFGQVPVVLAEDLPIDEEGEKVPVIIGTIRRVKTGVQSETVYDKPHGGESHYTSDVFERVVSEKPLDEIVLNIAAINS